MWELLLYRLAQWVALTLPIRLSYVIAERIGEGHFLFSHQDRRSVFHNLEIVCGGGKKRELQRKARSVFRHFGRYLVEFLRFPRLSRGAFMKQVVLEGVEHLDAALALGRGVIVVSAHVGNWELGAAGLALLGYPTNVIVLNHPNPAVNHLFIQMREEKGINVLSTTQPVWKTLACLSRGEILIMAADRDFSKNGMEVSFFHERAVFPKGPAAISLRSGSPMIFAFLIRESENFRFLFEPPLFPRGEGSFQENLMSMTQEVARRLEQQIRKDPSQWLIFESFWQERGKR